MLLRRVMPLLLALSLLSVNLPAAAQRPVPPDHDPKQTSMVDLPPQARAKIHPDLLKELVDAERAGLQHSPEGASGHASYIVHLTESARLEDLAAVDDLPKRRTQLVERLQRTAQKAQAPVLGFLAQRQADGGVTRYGSFWIFNGLVVESNLSTALALAQRADVASLVPNRVHQMSEPQLAEPTQPSASIPWNIAKIKVDQVWSVLGITGQGVVVANMDTGVDWTHPALLNSYRGYNADDPAMSSHDYNWFDPTHTYPTAPGPNRSGISAYSDHGTHCMGTLVGRTDDGAEQIGVAPGAKWVAVKIFNNHGSATDEWVHLGFQWCLAPTRLNGSAPDPSLAPDIVSNSWGDDENTTDTVFAADIAALRTAGIMTVFAAGNNGPGVGTVGSPASIGGVLAVGATDANDQIAIYSARGPSPWGEIKPEIVAPGSGVRSSIAGGGYAYLNGTSMAAPHVAGTAALLWSADRVRGYSPTQGEANNPTLTINETEEILINTALDLGAPGEDNVYGHGRINAYQAVSTILSVGWLAGTVTNAHTSAPIPGTRISLVNTVTGAQRTTTSEGDGNYELYAVQGTYDLSVKRYGYVQAAVPNVTIHADEITFIDVPLEPAPTGTLHGRVTSVSDGQPIAAVVEIVGAELSTPVDAQGYYTLTVEAGACTVLVRPTELGYRGQRSEEMQIPVQGELAYDAALASAPRLLLVDADASIFSTALYYSRDLAALLYPHDLLTIDDLQTSVPTAEELAPYDVVIWSQPISSPGYTDAWEALAAYLDGGGRMLISGQDIGFWDDLHGFDRSYFRHYLHAEFLSNGGLGQLTGAAHNVLEGLTLKLNAPDSAMNQQTADTIRLTDGLARPLVNGADGDHCGVLVDACSYRVAYLSFGLEGVGPTEARHEALDRLIEALWQERPARAVKLRLPSTRQAGEPDSTVTYRFWVSNDGQATERYDLSVDTPSWQARIVDPSTLQPVTHTGDLGPCETIELLLQVEVPRSAVVNDLEVSRLVALSAEGTWSSAEVRTSVQGSWSAGPALPEARQRHVVASTDCRLAVIGGFVDVEQSSASNSVALLDLATGAWTAGAPKPTAAADAGSAIVDGRVYVVGGVDPAASPETLDVVEVYDPLADAWSTAPALPQALSGVAVAAHGGHLYVFGGSTEGLQTSVAFRLDLATMEWATLALLPSPVSHASAAVLGEHIYLVGGWPQLTQLWRYEPINDTWTTLVNMRTGRQRPVVISAGGLLYVAGGGSYWQGIGSAERYDPATNEWEALPAMREANRAGAAGAYVDGCLYVLGGTGNSPTTGVEYLEVAPGLGGSYLVAGAALIAVGDELPYTLVLRNATGIAVEASWTHPLPDELHYVEDSATPGVSYDAATRTLHWSGWIEPHSTRHFGFSTMVDLDVPNATPITSLATLSGGGCASRDIGAVTSAYRPTLAASIKTVNRSVAHAGDTLHYRIALTNRAPITITEATLTDELPPHTTLVPMSLTGGATYNAASRRIEWAGEIAAATATLPEYEWIDASAGQRLLLSDDDCSGPLDLGFEFEFYGNRYDQIYVNSNGMVLFGAPSKAYSNVLIPLTSAPNNYIAPFWDDLVPTNGRISLATFGEAPSRYAVIEWNQVRTYTSNLSQTFEVVLFEGSNVILFQYGEMTGAPGTGSSATVGIENAAGTEGVLHLYNGTPAEHALYQGLVLEMVHSSTVHVTTHFVEYDLQVDADAALFTRIANRAHIVDRLGTHERSATTDIIDVNLSTSHKTAFPAGVVAGEMVTYTLRLVNTGSTAPDPLFVTDTLPIGLTLEPGSLTPGATYDAATREIRWAGTVWPQDEKTLRYAARVDVGLARGVLINTAVLRYADVTLELRAAVQVFRPGDTLVYLAEMYWQGLRR